MSFELRIFKIVFFANLTASSMVDVGKAAACPGWKVPRFRFILIYFSL